jgi:hypothetical protein
MALRHEQSSDPAVYVIGERLFFCQVWQPVVVILRTPQRHVVGKAGFPRESRPTGDSDSRHVCLDGVSLGVADDDYGLLHDHVAYHVVHDVDELVHASQQGIPSGYGT